MEFLQRIREGSDGKSLTPRQVELLEAVRSGRIQMQFGDLREALGTDLFDNVTLDAMHNRAMMGHGQKVRKSNWRPLANIVPIPDFRSHNATRINGSYSDLEKIPEGGRYKIVKPTDEKVQYVVEVYGAMEAFSMQAMANDNLNLLGRTAQRFGSAAALRFLKFFFQELIDDNPTMPYDGVALFHSSHGNNLGASTPLNATNLDAAWELLAAQTGMDGEPLELMPGYLIVNPAEELAARRLMGASNLIVGAHDAGASATAMESPVNVHQGRYEIIVSSYITAGRWYLACGADDCDTIDIGFFNGQQEPSIMRERDGSGYEFEYDARRMKVRHIFGGANKDHRWIVRGNAA